MSPDSILGALMQGTGRRPLNPSGIFGEGLDASDPATAPRLLALAVQALRFDPPNLPASYDEAARPLDPCSIVPEASRPLILRLVAGKRTPADDIAAARLAWSIGQHGLRLHPFDLARLGTFASKHAETLGIGNDVASGEECYWSGAQSLDASNWAYATTAMKAQFIAELRSTDPAAARTLVEAQLPLEKAPVRVRLIDALATGLDADDIPLLESLAKDRAPTVKQAATRLLARLPGTGASAAQVEELVSRIEQGKTGLIRKRASLKLQLPANLRSEPAIIDWLSLNFGGVSNRALASAFGMSPNEMLDAANHDHRLVTGIAFAASTDLDWALLGEIAQRHRQTIWKDFLQPGLAAFGIATDAEKVEWLNAALPRRLDADRVAAHELLMLYDAIGGPLPLGHARGIMKIAHHIMPQSPEAMTAAIALTPEHGLAEFAEILKRRSPDITRRASLLAETLISLNQGRPTP